MDQPARAAGFGELLRRWRRHRGVSQLALALDAEVSARHLSWLECGKSLPGRAMVLRLAERLDLPLRERNAMLLAAGFAPMYAERTLADPALASAREAIDRLLAAHEPWPALAVDRHWNLVAHNRAVALLMRMLPEPLRRPPANVLRASLHPQGFAGMVEDLPGWRAHLLQRLRRQLAATADPVLEALLGELRGYPPGTEAAPAEPDPVAASLVLRTPFGRLHFVTTITVFGAPHDLLLSELAIETLLPADAATAATLRALPLEDATAA